MAIMHLKSTNDNLSFVLQKNPASGMFIKNCRAGLLFAFFPKFGGVSSKTEYVIHFRDSADEISYKRHPDENFEYLNSSKYNDARFINDAIQEILHSAREGKGDSATYDVPANHEIVFTLCETQYKTIDIFKRYFQDVEITSTEVSKDNYSLSFKSNEPMKLQRLLMVVNLFGVFAWLNSPTYSYFTEDLVKKYVRIANEIDAPYFIKYLIKVRMCRSESKFITMKEELEKSNRYSIKMDAGDTHDMRISWIKLLIDCTRPIVDIGTGIDFRYLKIFAPRLKDANLMYYAIERDDDAYERISAALKNRGLEDTVMVFKSLEEFLDYKNDYLGNEIFDVLCTEVLEHNEYNDAQALVKKVKSSIKHNKFILTLPNAEFNQFYGIEGFRHDDHKWEASMDDVNNLMPKGTNYEVHNVGDVVDNIPVSYGIIIEGNGHK